MTESLRLAGNAVAVPRWARGQKPPNRGYASKLWLGHPNLAALLTRCGQLILRKIIKFDITRCQILRIKSTKFDFRMGSAPDPAGGAYSAPLDPVAVFNKAYV